MAVAVRRGSDAVLYALVSQFNALRHLVAQGAGQFHLEVTGVTTGDFTAPTVVPLVIASPAATDLPSLLQLCTEVRGKYPAHAHDGFAHLAADLADDLAKAPPPAVLADAIAFLNDATAKYNAHLSQQGVHVANDPNKITVANAADLPSAIALANAYRAAFNTHIQAAPAGASIQLLNS